MAPSAISNSQLMAFALCSSHLVLRLIYPQHLEQLELIMPEPFVVFDGLLGSWILYPAWTDVQDIIILSLFVEYRGNLFNFSSFLLCSAGCLNALTPIVLCLAWKQAAKVLSIFCKSFDTTHFFFVCFEMRCLTRFSVAIKESDTSCVPFLGTNFF